MGANFIRGEKAYNLRRGMSQVDMLLGGFDAGDGPSLYFIDYLSSMQKIDKGAHGYGGFFVNSLLDAHWKPGLTEAEALTLMDLCIKELHTRFFVSMPNWSIISSTRTARGSCGRARSSEILGGGR